MYIKKGDTIKVMRGKDAGKSAKVIQTFPQTGYIIAEGVNMRFRHLRPRRQGEKGQRVEFPARLPISNVMLLCPKCNKTTRIKYSQPESKKKTRVCKKCSAPFT